MKPDTGGEATGKSTCRAFRGEWGQRAGKDPLRNLFALARDVQQRRKWQHDRQSRGKHNKGTGADWKSEGSVVAKKRVMTVERRDPTENNICQCLPCLSGGMHEDTTTIHSHQVSLIGVRGHMDCGRDRARLARWRGRGVKV